MAEKTKEKRIEEKHDTEENMVRGNGKGGKRISEVRTRERITWNARKKEKERVRGGKGEEFQKGLKANGEREGEERDVARLRHPSTFFTSLPPPPPHRFVSRREKVASNFRLTSG